MEGKARRTGERDKNSSIVSIGHSSTSCNHAFLVPEERDIVSLEEAPVGHSSAGNGVLVQPHKSRLALHSGCEGGSYIQVLPTQWGRMRHAHACTSPAYSPLHTSGYTEGLYTFVALRKTAVW